MRISSKSKCYTRRFVKRDFSSNRPAAKSAKRNRISQLPKNARQSFTDFKRLIDLGQTVCDLSRDSTPSKAARSDQVFGCLIAAVLHFRSCPFQNCIPAYHQSYCRPVNHSFTAKWSIEIRNFAVFLMLATETTLRYRFKHDSTIWKSRRGELRSDNVYYVSSLPTTSRKPRWTGVLGHSRLNLFRAVLSNAG